MVFAAVAAGVFFKQESVQGDASLQGRGFADFRNSWLTMWVFVTSGENMQDVLSAGSGSGNALSVFFSKLLFILVSFVGMYVIVALMIASFQEVHATRDAAEQLRMLKQRRQGIVAAFATLDVDDRGILTFDRYYELIAVLSGARSLGALQEADRGGLRLPQFVDVMEKVLFGPLNGSLEPTARFVRVFGEGGAFAERRTKRFDFSTIVNQGVFARFFSLYGQEQLLPWLDRFAVTLVFLQVVTLSLVGTFVGDEVLIFQRAVPVFIILNVIEIALRINISGWAGYWQLDDGARPYSRARARFDFAVVCCAVVLWFASVLPVAELGGGLAATRTSWPGLAAMVLPIARMFSVVESTRGLVFGLAHVLPTCLSLFIVLLVVCYAYALVGLLLFQGRLDKLPSSIYANQGTNFNTMPDAMLTVLQLTNGEGWDQVMFATVDAVNSLWPVLYFLSFSLCVMILFSNIVVGVIIDAFHQLQHSVTHGGSRGGGPAITSEARTRFEEVLVALCHKALMAKDTEYRRGGIDSGRFSEDGMEDERRDSDTLAMGAEARAAAAAPAAADRACPPAAAPPAAAAPVAEPTAAPAVQDAVEPEHTQASEHSLVMVTNTITEI